MSPRAWCSQTPEIMIPLMDVTLAIGGRGFGITYNSKANPILSANWIWAIDLRDFGRAGLRTVRIVRIGAYRKYARERILFFGGIFG